MSERITNIIRPVAEDLGYDVVRVQMLGGRRPTLQVMAEPIDGREMTVEDCARLSRELSPVLDVADAIEEAYRLEVSSPGLDRPLTRIRDYQRFNGEEAKIELDMPVNDRKRFTGKLRGVEDDVVLIECEPGDVVEIAFASIRRAKLVLTDELLARAASAQALGDDKTGDGETGDDKAKAKGENGAENGADTVADHKTKKEGD